MARSRVGLASSSNVSRISKATTANTKRSRARKTASHFAGGKPKPKKLSQGKYVDLQSVKGLTPRSLTTMVKELHKNMKRNGSSFSSIKNKVARTMGQYVNNVTMTHLLNLAVQKGMLRKQSDVVFTLSASPQNEALKASTSQVTGSSLSRHSARASLAGSTSRAGASQTISDSGAGSASGAGIASGAGSASRTSNPMQTRSRSGVEAKLRQRRHPLGGLRHQVEGEESECVEMTDMEPQPIGDIDIMPTDKNLPSTSQIVVDSMAGCDPVMVFGYHN